MKTVLSCIGPFGLAMLISFMPLAYAGSMIQAAFALSNVVVGILFVGVWVLASGIFATVVRPPSESRDSNKELPDEALSISRSGAALARASFSRRTKARPRGRRRIKRAG